MDLDDSLEIDLDGDDTIALVLPIVTQASYNFSDSWNRKKGFHFDYLTCEDISISFFVLFLVKATPCDYQ